MERRSAIPILPVRPNHNPAWAWFFVRDSWATHPVSKDPEKL
jgi:hypothetical protein